MKKLKKFPKMFIQIFSVLGIIIILVHSLVFFIFPKTYLETRKEKIHNIANEISSNMNGKEIQELYERSEKEKLENHSVEEYYDQFDKEYEEFVKKMEE